jgi:hypothetical protein
MATAKWRQQLQGNPLLEAWDALGDEVGHLDIKSLDGLVPSGYGYVEKELRIVRAAIVRSLAGADRRQDR